MDAAAVLILLCSSITQQQQKLLTRDAARTCHVSLVSFDVLCTENRDTLNDMESTPGPADRNPAAVPALQSLPSSPPLRRAFAAAAGTRMSASM